MSVVIKARDVKSLGSGYFEVELDIPQLTQEDRAAIQKLFPRLSESAYELLEQEVLLDSLVPRSEEAWAREQAKLDSDSRKKKSVKAYPMPEALED